MTASDHAAISSDEPAPEAPSVWGAGPLRGVARSVWEKVESLLPDGVIRALEGGDGSASFSAQAGAWLVAAAAAWAAAPRVFRRGKRAAAVASPGRPGGRTGGGPT